MDSAADTLEAIINNEYADAVTAQVNVVVVTYKLHVSVISDFYLCND